MLNLHTSGNLARATRDASPETLRHPALGRTPHATPSVLPGRRLAPPRAIRAYRSRGRRPPYPRHRHAPALLRLQGRPPVPLPSPGTVPAREARHARATAPVHVRGGSGPRRGRPPRALPGRPPVPGALPGGGAGQAQGDLPVLRRPPRLARTDGRIGEEARRKDRRRPHPCLRPRPAAAVRNAGVARVLGAG